MNTNIKTVNHVHRFDVKHLRNKQTQNEPKMSSNGPKSAELSKTFEKCTISATNDFKIASLALKVI